ncbi:putative GNAT family acetyltransferase [Agromyces cerinus]|uniref:GNAT family N-acetyltransferase n=1 Tax=Agromyces cerinus TaxID=33878 RepID=UPI00195B69AD|nr:GNAT family N-acetyltransferase [Agromyces cerinus]MBM7832059.1 putative GNAT family acetyltransferase [Agromyces cerinus]
MATDIVEIVRNDDRHRYDLTFGGERAGFAQYRLEDGAIVFTHTVVLPEFEGRGLGSKLARTALDDAVARGERIVPECPFIVAYLRRHEEYEASVDWP